MQQLLKTIMMFVFLDVLLTDCDNLNTDAHPTEYGKLFQVNQNRFLKLAHLTI